MEARNKLENYVFGVKNACRDCGDKLSSEDRVKVDAEGDRIRKWLDSSQLASKEYEHMLEEMHKFHGQAA